MKLLFVGTNPGNNGASAHFVALANAMSQARHEVNAVVYPGSLLDRGLAISNVRVHHGNFRNVLDPNGYRAVGAAAARLKPDWIIGNFGKEYWPLIGVSRALKIPVALFRHRAPPMKRLSNYWVPRLAQRFIVVSDYLRKVFIARGVPAHLIDVLYNPINMELFQFNAQDRTEVRLSLGLPTDAILLGYFGRINPTKGVFPLFEAVNQAMLQNPKLHCLWIGDGDSMQELHAAINAHPLVRRHHFIGWIDDLHPYYSALSMLAFPSIEPETFGRVAVEAQACGVPVLVSKLGGAPETFNPSDTGLLVPPNDVRAWRDAILTMCDSERRVPMAQAARAYVEPRFSTDAVTEDFTKMLARAGRAAEESVSNSASCYRPSV